MPNVSTATSDSRTFSKLFSDLDFYRRRYSMKEADSDLKSILVEFVSPVIIAYEEYRFYLLQNSEVKSISPKNYYRPDYVSYDEYGTTNLWAMLLFINDIPTIEDFDVRDILIPSYNSILNISKDVVRRSYYTDIVPQFEVEKKETAKLYYRKQSIPVARISTPSRIFTPPTLYYDRENFIVTNFIARSMYVDLKYEPVAKSVTFKIANNPSYIYNKHYVVVRGSKGMNRISWDPRQMLTGVGLIDTINEGDEIEIQYVKNVL